MCVQDVQIFTKREPLKQKSCWISQARPHRQELGFLVSNEPRYGGGWGCCWFEETLGNAAPMSCCASWLVRHTLWPASGGGSILRSAIPGRDIRWCKGIRWCKRLQDGDKFRSWRFVFCVKLSAKNRCIFGSLNCILLSFSRFSRCEVEPPVCWGLLLQLGLREFLFPFPGRDVERTRQSLPWARGRGHHLRHCHLDSEQLIHLAAGAIKMFLPSNLCKVTGFHNKTQRRKIG